jgi:hypothetical protein
LVLVAHQRSPGQLGLSTIDARWTLARVAREKPATGPSAPGLHIAKFDRALIRSVPFASDRNSWYQSSM